ncbi:aldehyde dehydrogenase family protein [Mangrovibacter sp. SLW1]
MICAMLIQCELSLASDCYLPGPETLNEIKRVPLYVAYYFLRRISMAYATTNPFTGEVIKTFPDATDAEVTDAIARAHNTFTTWRNVSFSQRGEILQNAANLLRKQKTNLRVY